MDEQTKNEILQTIKSLSNNDTKLEELLMNSLGRLCFKAAKVSENWSNELHSIDVLHIVDWLKAAIINEAEWLNNIDHENRPKKLMKFGTFFEVQREADKAMRITNQQNRDIKLIDGDEELHMQLEDGYHLVKLLTPAALKREGEQMQHCIGGGAYDKKINNNIFHYLSLRDKAGKPHATLEIRNQELLQLQGKQNKPPNSKYSDILATSFTPENPLKITRTSIPVKDLGFIICSKGYAHKDMCALPKHLHIKGCLKLEQTHFSKLPDNLIVDGNLNLDNSYLNELPQNLKVGGNLSINNPMIKSLPNNMHIGGELLIYMTSIKSLPKGLFVGGTLRLHRLKIKELPDDLIVKSGVRLEFLKLQSIPENSGQLNGNLSIKHTTINSMPKNLNVNGNLNIEHSKFKQKPKAISIKNNLKIVGSNLKKLPKETKVGGSMILDHSNIKKIPKSIKSIQTLSIIDTKIKKLPDNLEIRGNLITFHSRLKKLSKNMKVHGDLSLLVSKVKQLPDNLHVGGFVDLRHSKVESLPKGLVVEGVLGIMDTDIKKLPDDLVVNDAIIGFLNSNEPIYPKEHT